MLGRDSGGGFRNRDGLKYSADTLKTRVEKKLQKLKGIVVWEALSPAGGSSNARRRIWIKVRTLGPWPIQWARTWAHISDLQKRAEPLRRALPRGLGTGAPKNV